MIRRGSILFSQWRGGLFITSQGGKIANGVSRREARTGFLFHEEGKIKQCRQQQIREHPVLSEGQKRSTNEAMLPAEDVHDMRKSSDIEQRRKGPKVYHIPLRGLRLSRVPLVREAAAVESGQIFQVEQFLFERCCVEAISCNRRQDPPIPP